MRPLCPAIRAAQFGLSMTEATAPWFAMEITNRDPRRYELLILSENVDDLEKGPSYVKFEKYRQIWIGLGDCETSLQR